MSAGKSGTLHVLDAFSGKIVRYSDNSESSIGVRDVIREYDCSYLLAYVKGSEFGEKVLLLRYPNYPGVIDV